MPEFTPGEVKTAIAPITVKPSGLSCSAELYLASNSTKVATSGEIPFISTGLDQAISLPITMPSVEGAYPVYLDVLSGGVFIKGFRTVEDVVIAPAVPLASCVYDGAQFTTESELVAHMNTNHPGKPYLVWAYLPEENVLLTPGQEYTIKAKVFAPSTSENENWIYAFWSKTGCIARLIVVGKGAPAGFYIGEATSYHCYHKLGRWYCPPLGENIVRSDCYFHIIGYRWNANPVWESVDIGLRVNFTT